VVALAGAGTLDITVPRCRVYTARIATPDSIMEVNIDQRANQEEKGILETTSQRRNISVSRSVFVIISGEIALLYNLVRGKILFTPMVQNECINIYLTDV